LCSSGVENGRHNISEKFLRDARVMTLYEGTSQIHKLLFARAETGHNAFV